MESSIEFTSATIATLRCTLYGVRCTGSISKVLPFPVYSGQMLLWADKILYTDISRVVIVGVSVGVASVVRLFKGHCYYRWLPSSCHIYLLVIRIVRVFACHQPPPVQSILPLAILTQFIPLTTPTSPSGVGTDCQLGD